MAGVMVLTLEVNELNKKFKKLGHGRDKDA